MEEENTQKTVSRHLKRAYLVDRTGAQPDFHKPLGGNEKDKRNAQKKETAKQCLERALSLGTVERLATVVKGFGCDSPA